MRSTEVMQLTPVESEGLRLPRRWKLRLPWSVDKGGGAGTGGRGAALLMYLQVGNGCAGGAIDSTDGADRRGGGGGASTAEAVDASTTAVS